MRPSKHRSFRLSGGHVRFYLSKWSDSVVFHTSSIVAVVSSGSLKTTDFPPRSNLIFFKADGVGDDASGYSFGSSSWTARGGLINNGGKEVVVVVVVVTTVVRVAGAKENWPMEPDADP